jgi:hydroxypyruvate reductase
MIRNIPELIKGSPGTQHARQRALALLNVALNAVNPHNIIPRALKRKNHILQFADKRVNLDDLPGIYVIGAGKATGRMAEATETLLQEYITGGLIIVPETTLNAYSLNQIEVHGGGHPTPNNASVTATQQLINLLDQTPEDALIISLFSGGGSALFTFPTPPLRLSDVQNTTRLLVNSGMPIEQINTVRKHLSQVKGGHLAKHIHPRQHWGLLISDVPGDQLDMIASGPTLPDPSTYSDITTILEAYNLWDKLPAPVQEHITAGIQSKHSDTPKPGNPLFDTSVHKLVASNQDACQAVLAQAQHENFQTRILTTNCQGEAREVGDQLGRLAQQLTTKNKPQILIVGSETTVTVRHEGKGGRNTELITAAIPHLHETDGLAIASLASDGIDGPTDAAGAIADGDSYQRAQNLNLSPSQFLETNSTYQFFERLNDLIFTGPTHTNVRDITLILWKGIAPDT